MFKKYLQIIIIALPIFILLGGGIYYAYDSWERYTKNNNLKVQLDNTRLLQSLKYSVLNEIVCVTTMSKNKELMEKVCNTTKKTTDNVMQEILSQKEDSSLHALEKVIYNMRDAIKNSGNKAVEKLVNGVLDKELNTFIKKYSMKLQNNPLLQNKKEYVVLFNQISDISYATALEKALLSYYLALHKPMPAAHLMYWDEIVSRADLFESLSGDIEHLKSHIYTDKFQTLLRSIEDVRIDVMTYASSGLYKHNVATWVSLINNKQKVLSSIESKALEDIYSFTDLDSKKIFTTLLIALATIFLSILGLWLLLQHWRNKNKNRKSLADLVSKVSQFTSNGEDIKISDDSSSQKIAYAYIASSFETLYEKESKLDSENKTNAIFLNNMSYEIRTPLDGIEGYTKLLKETPLNSEQSDYVSIIENSFENLQAVLNKKLNNTQLSVQKLEIENNTFDVVKKVELAIETYAMKADQKDILLGIYIDPMLSYKVKGDGTKISHILTNLIDNALEASNAYDVVNIFVEKVHSSDDQVTIKFSIEDQGLGYTPDELDKIKSAFTSIKNVDSIPNFDIKNLSISNKIIKRMGGTLELESTKGEGSKFFFTLNLDKDIQEKSELYPIFDGMSVGLALPLSDMNRQVDKNLETYVKYLGAEFKIYLYDDIFVNNKDIELPELMFFYHNYARLEGELEAFSALECKTALITSGTLRARINTQKHHFSSIVYAPITMRKVIHIFVESKVETPILIDEEVKELTSSKKFENIHALVAEDNEISQKIMLNILKNFEIEVTVASNGKEAFELRREQDFNIIFMDMNMPIIDGYECVSKILYFEGVNQQNHVPIISLGIDVNNTKDENRKIGIDGFIKKPFDPDDVYDIVHKYCVEIPKKMQAQEEDDFIAKVLSEDFLKEDL